MAELVAAFLQPAIELVKLVAAPIVRQFNYLCCFTSNIKGLNDEAEKLDDEARELQCRLDRERDNSRDIVPKAVRWLSESNDVKSQTSVILDQVPNVESGCLNVGTRYSLSKRAKKTTNRMKELRGECKFDVISLPKPPAATEAVPLGNTYDFESRKQIEQDIMETLRGGNVRMIGICGMGGLGKTIMAKRIMNKVLEEHVFEEVLMAVVSQQVDKSKIQEEIGGSLGLNLKEVLSDTARVQKLRARLSSTKKILLVLDDVWQKLVLEDLVIPCDSKRCTILITSRNRDGLQAMKVEKIFGMQVLSIEEAWFFFREEVGTHVDDNKLNSIAKQVVQKCRGLPIALTTVGAALRDEKEVSIWKYALRQLKQCDSDVPEFIQEVYSPLKLSYDFLKSKPAKSLLLLCCLFPEDANIRLERLAYFCIRLGIFEEITNLENARDKMCALIKMLKSRSLLLDSEEKDAVRMHDVVRDVCIFIAKQEKHIGGNDCTWISTFQPPTGLEFPNLRLVYLSHNNRKGNEVIKLDTTFLEGIRDLYVLCIEKYTLTSLPHTTQSLTNLNTLFLHACWILKSISGVGELVNLEILICRYCHEIEELPEEIKGLHKLKLLELTWCGKLKSVGRGIISSLVELEELKMTYSFMKWEAEDGGERKNAGLRELEALTKLRCLEIEIEDPALVTEKMRLSSKIERFCIKIPRENEWSFGLNPPSSFDKILILQLKTQSCVGDWIGMQLVRDTKWLHLSGDGANNVDLAKSQNIRWLDLRDCETITNIVRTSHCATVFPSIEHLTLAYLPELQVICEGPLSSTSFTNLSSINIWSCNRLRNLGQLSTAAGKDCLPQLQELQIKHSEMMEQVFLWKGEDENTSNISESSNPHIITKMFPKLSNVLLYSLPNLATFYQGIQGIEFPLLMELRIVRCPKMKFIKSCDNSGGSSSTYVDDHSAQKVSFDSLKKLVIIENGKPFILHKIYVSVFNGLKELRVYECDGCMSLFTSSMTRNLVSLEVLIIEECKEMVKVIEDEEVASSDGRIPLFPELKKLQLRYLPKLVSFCEWKCEVELPSLRKVIILRCYKMKNFTMGSIAATPNIENIEIEDENLGGTTDLNGALQQAKEKQEERKRG